MTGKTGKTAKQRQLEADWQALLVKHSKPLERGAISKGIKLVAPAVASTLPPVDKPRARFVNDTGTARQSAALPRAVGQLYNKGPIQFISEQDALEQRTGSHLRRP